jgi:hypothetical protein
MTRKTTCEVYNHFPTAFLKQRKERLRDKCGSEDVTLETSDKVLQL